MPDFIREWKRKTLAGRNRQTDGHAGKLEAPWNPEPEGSQTGSAPRLRRLRKDPPPPLFLFDHFPPAMPEIKENTSTIHLERRSKNTSDPLELLTPTLTSEEEARAWRKIDMRLMPILALLYLFCFLDRGALSWILALGSHLTHYFRKHRSASIYGYSRADRLTSFRARKVTRFDRTT